MTKVHTALKLWQMIVQGYPMMTTTQQARIVTKLQSHASRLHQVEEEEGFHDQTGSIYGPPKVPPQWAYQTTILRPSLLVLRRIDPVDLSCSTFCHIHRHNLTSAPLFCLGMRG